MKKAFRGASINSVGDIMKPGYLKVDLNPGKGSRTSKMTQ